MGSLMVWKLVISIHHKEVGSQLREVGLKAIDFSILTKFAYPELERERDSTARGHIQDTINNLEKSLQGWDPSNLLQPSEADPPQ